ncbi:hypothetical protein GCM10027614_13290 [Micromonospora vulcania]
MGSGADRGGGAARAARPAAALGAVVLAFVALPSGFGPDAAQVVLAATGVLVGLLAVGSLRLLLPSAPVRVAP